MPVDKHGGTEAELATIHEELAWLVRELWPLSFRALLTFAAAERGVAILQKNGPSKRPEARFAAGLTRDLRDVLGLE